MKIYNRRFYTVQILLLILIEGYAQPIPFNKMIADSINHELPYMKDDTNKINNLILLSQMYIAKGDSMRVMKYAHEADSLAQKINSNIGRIKALGQMAFYHATTGNWPQSIMEINEAIPLTHKEKTEWSIFLYNLKFINYAAKNDLIQARIWALKALRHPNFESSSVLSKWPTYMQLGLSYEWENRLDSAQFYADILKEYVKKYRHPDLEGNTYTLLGNIARKKKNYEEALYYYRQGDQSIMGLAWAYDEMNKVDSAIYYAKLALNNARQRYDPRIILESTQLLARRYGQTNPALSNQYLNQYVDIKESLFNSNKLKQLEEIRLNEQQLRFDQIGREKAFRSKIIQYSLISLAALFFISALFFYRNNQIKKAANKQLEEINTALKTTQTQLEIKNRDLEIEAALERVRAKSLEMHRSDELKEVVATLYEQLQHLGFQYGAASIIIMDSETTDSIQWVGGFNQSEYPIGYYIKHFNHPAYVAQFTSWQNGDKYKELLLAGEEKQAFDEYMFTQTDFKNFPEEGKAFMKSLPSVVFSMAFLKHGALQWGPEKINDEQAKILQKFAVVFEQAYTRFLDLQKAEAQAREAQIEAALERVRSRTMAMQKSEHLVEIINVVAQQLLHLNFRLNTASFFLNDESEKFTFWLAAIGESNPEKIVIPKLSHPVLNNIKEAQKNGVDFFTDTLSFEEKNAWFQHVFAHSSGRVPEDRQKYILNTEGYARSVVLMKQIGLFIVNYVPQPYTDAENAIFKRFAFAFEQAYTRFLDLQKAEAQAREAQIEVALEKVRSRTMAMQKSEDLRDVTIILYDQLKVLGFNNGAAAITIMDALTGDMDWWMEGLGDGYAFLERYHVRYFNHKSHNEQLANWKNGASYATVKVSGEEKKAYDKYYFNDTDFIRVPQETMELMMQQETVIFSMAYMRFGSLSWSPSTISDEQAKILQRFAQVFEQTYIRFLDLLKAEAQAREAQIELALERVRAKTMAMQKSHELREVAATIFEQLQQQGFHFGALAIVIMDEISGDSDWWMSGFGNEYPEKYKIPFFNHRFYKEQLSNWKEGKKYAVMEVSGEEKRMYDDYIFSQTDFTKVSQEAKNVMCGFEEITFSNAYMKHGALSWGTTPICEDDARILQRFATVFEQTYTRFLDLQKAETQAKEAQIEVALERVRAKALAMQSSMEINTVIATIYRECNTLFKDVIASLIIIYDKETLDSDWYIAKQEDPDFPSGFRVPQNKHNFSLAMLEAWKQKSYEWEYFISPKEKAAWDDYIFTETDFTLLPDIVRNAMRSAKTLYCRASFGDFGCVMLSTLASSNNEQKIILARITKAFDFAYTRFNDLKLAEAQAEQAHLDLIQIQTEKKRAEDALIELRITQTQLIQKEKLASLGELTAGIAHEIQNPLNFVNNFSELSVDLVKDLKEEIEKSTQDKEYIGELFDDLSQNQEKINHHGKRASSIVKGMLEHSRASTGVKELTDINKLADEYLRLSYHGLRAKDKDFNADFSTDFDENLLKINIIPQDIGRVLLNLINNAFYAVNQRRQDVLARNEAISSYTPSVLVSTEQVDNQIIIKVKDNGTGMPESVKAKVFQPFFTTKPTGQGTGLGLSLAYDIVTKGHGGSLEVESTEGVGSEFIITLPFKTNG